MVWELGVKECDTVLAPQNHITSILHGNNRSSELKLVFRFLFFFSAVIVVMGEGARFLARNSQR